MDQRHALEESEPVSSEELRALIERFGERQAAQNDQPTVKDVAETLQVEPATVAAMLQQLRESKNQQEIKERLDRLERENAELRARSEAGYPMYGFGLRPRDRRRRLLVMGSAMLMALGVVMAARVAARGIAFLLPVLIVLLIGFWLVRSRLSQRD